MKSTCKCGLWIICLGLLPILYSCNTSSPGKKITMERLLDEMVSVEELALYPDPYYTCHQESSHDRTSVSPDKPGWFANNDGFGIIRTEKVEGRTEKVMFDQSGPGAITRIWITTIDKRGTWRFYFDGSDTPGWIIPAYDLMLMGIPGVGRGLVQPHTSYTPDGKGGNTSFLPIPYAKSCKITFEDEPGVNPTPKYYGINYRKYPTGTQIETFSLEVMARAKDKIARTDEILLNPSVKPAGKLITENVSLASSDSLSINLPEGENAVYEVKFDIHVNDQSQYEQAMRELVFCAEFDGKQTVWVPLSDFSGGGMGAPYVDSWYLLTDGKGKISSRWLMPYRQKATLKLLNISSSEVGAKMTVNVSPLAWKERSLYFHASWREETGIYIHNKPEEDEKCIDWNFATIKGKGVYKGDLLSLFNHAPRWYGEGDEKIWMDDDTFPSHFGTGTEDYYNSSWAPVVPFHTPFGGAPRADLESSHGYNAFFRTRNLDGIPFKRDFKFDIEMLGWDNGYVDYATTIYWYGDYNAKAYGLSGVKEARRKLVPAPPKPEDYKIPDSIEFENIQHSAKSPDIRIDKQSMQGFTTGKWSNGKQLTCPGGKPNDFIEFVFDNLKERKYKLVLHATKASDYGILTFYVNDKPTNIRFDGYSDKVINSKPVNLGTFSADSGKIKLKVEITGTNKKSKGAKHLIGLDCLQFMPM